MNFPIKPICERRFVRKDGTSLIYIQYCYSADKRILLNTEIAIPPQYWNKKKLCVSGNMSSQFGDVEYLNQELKRMLNLAEEVIAYAVQAKIPKHETLVKETFKPNLDIIKLKEDTKSNKGDGKNMDLYYQIDEYSKSKEKKVCKDMPRIYRNMKEHLKAFELFTGRLITFDSLDLNFYEEFVDFLTYDYVQRRKKVHTVGLKVNTIGKTIK